MSKNKTTISILETVKADATKFAKQKGWSFSLLVQTALEKVLKEGKV